jgi:hypothetical protein
MRGSDQLAIVIVLKLVVWIDTDINLRMLDVAGKLAALRRTLDLR